VSSSPDADATRLPGGLTTFELVALVAALSALNALSIDIMLPALPDIDAAFSLINPNDRQLVIVAYVLPFGLAQLIYGPLADSLGRKRVLTGALCLFIAGAVLCVFAPSFELLLAARALQGVGAAATRVISVAVVRDLTSGRRMAQIMSMAMTVFMIIPIIAPSIGQLILLAAPWRWIFATLLIYAVSILAWTILRLPETLAPENRRAFNLPAIVGAYAFVLRQRQTFGYMLACSVFSGALFGYITSSEQIFVEHYALDRWFGLAFASVAIAITIGTFVNSRIVMRYGMRRISHAMTLWFTLSAAAHAALVAAGLSPLWLFLPLLALTVSAFGLVAGNFNALAMEPVGQFAGSGAALFGGATSTIGAILGGLIGRAYDGTPLPLLLGLTSLGAMTLAAILWTERGRLFVDPTERRSGPIG